MTTFQAYYHPELFARFHKAVDDAMASGKTMGGELDEVVREAMALPLDGLVNFCAEIAFATPVRETAIFRIGVLAGVISRLSKE